MLGDKLVCKECGDEMVIHDRGVCIPCRRAEHRGELRKMDHRSSRQEKNKAVRKRKAQEK